MEWWDKFDTIGECKPIKEQIVLSENNQPERSKREDSIEKCDCGRTLYKMGTAQLRCQCSDHLYI